MKSPDIRFLAWSIFALALSLPATAWVWSHGERPAPQTIVVSASPVAPLAPAPLQQAAPLPDGVPVDCVPVAFMDAVTFPRNEGAEVRYTVNRDAQAVVDILSPDGAVVRSLGSSHVQAGVQEVAFWDGKDSAGKLAPLRHYQIQITALAGGRTAQINKPISLLTLLERSEAR